MYFIYCSERFFVKASRLSELERKYVYSRTRVCWSRPFQLFRAENEPKTSTLFYSGRNQNARVYNTIVHRTSYILVYEVYPKIRKYQVNTAFAVLLLLCTRNFSRHCLLSAFWPFIPFFFGPSRRQTRQASASAPQHQQQQQAVASMRTLARAFSFLPLGRKHTGHTDLEHPTFQYCTAISAEKTKTKTGSGHAPVRSLKPSGF